MRQQTLPSCAPPGVSSVHPVAPSPPTCSPRLRQDPPDAILPAPGFGSGSPPGSVVGLSGYTRFIARRQAQGGLMDVPDRSNGAAGMLGPWESHRPRSPPIREEASLPDLLLYRCLSCAASSLEEALLVSCHKNTSWVSFSFCLVGRGWS